MPTFKEIAAVVESKLPEMSNFKIGKTGQSIEARYAAEYSDTYSHILELAWSDDSGIIDRLEVFLIKLFYEQSNCDNEQLGGGKITNSDKYYVYLVFNL